MDSMLPHPQNWSTVPEKIERGETCMLNPALSAVSDLDGMTTNKEFRVVYISGGNPMVALIKG